MSEVLAQSKSDKSETALLFSVVDISKEKAIIKLRRSKTDQKGHGAHIVLAAAPLEICPVRALADQIPGNFGRVTCPDTFFHMPMVFR